MRLRYNYRLYPSPGQRVALAKAFGCARVVFNDGLAARQAAHAAGLPYIGDTELQKQVITQAKKTQRRAWLGEVSVPVPQGSPPDRPPHPQRLCAAAEWPDTPGQGWGSEGPLVAAAARRSVQRHRDQGRGRLGTSPPYAKVADARREFHHQLSTWLIRDNQAVYVETLNVKGLTRFRLAKSVHDAGWSAFVAMLEDKARRAGRTFARVDRWYPSSQMCSECGRRDGPKPLRVREWACPACLAVHDRDRNAARNILIEGRRISDRTVAAGREAAPEMVRGAETLNTCGDAIRPPFTVARVIEPGTRQKPTAA